MPFRERAKALFKPRSRGDSSLSKSSSKDSKASSARGGDQRWPSNVYKPGEPMPRPKYRRPPTKEHKEKLEAFSFSEAWRRKSFQSQYSPMGTRAPSRRASWMSLGRKSSVGRKSGLSRNSSVASRVSLGGPTDKGGVRQRENVGGGAARATRLSTEVEAEGDDDVGNVGLSRVQSREKNPLTRPQSLIKDTQPNAAAFRSLVTAHDHQPFSEEELALALRRSHLAVPVPVPAQ